MTILEYCHDKIKNTITSETGTPSRHLLNCSSYPSSTPQENFSMKILRIFSLSLEGVSSLTKDAICIRTLKCQVPSNAISIGVFWLLTLVHLRSALKRSGKKETVYITAPILDYPKSMRIRTKSSWSSFTAPCKRVPRPLYPMSTTVSQFTCTCLTFLSALRITIAYVLM